MKIAITLFCLWSVLAVSKSDNQNIQESTDHDNEVKIQRRIVGGREARKNEVPYQVGVRLHETTTFGGGVIVGRNWVMTAGHVVIDQEGNTAYPPDEVELVIGGRNLTEVDDEPWVVHVDRFFPHPQYKGTANDIALIKTKEPLIVNQDGYEAKPAQLPSSRQNFAGRRAVASGYGLTTGEKGGETSDTAKVVNLQIWDTNRCKQRNGHFNPTMNVCAGTASAENICGGDSGGPLVIVNNGQATVVGISSFITAKCGTANKPTYFTNVANYVDWAKQTMSSN